MADLRLLAVASTLLLLAAGCQEVVEEGGGPDAQSFVSADGGGSGGGGTPDVAMPDHCEDGPLAEPIEGCEPSPVPSSGDPYADCVARINQFRRECQCLPPLQRWKEAESCADEMAEYDSTNGAHAGFSAGICSPRGRAQNECPGYGAIRGGRGVLNLCLQMMWDEGPGKPFSEHGHYINMSSQQHSKVACGFYETSGGQIWAVQNFR